MGCETPLGSGGCASWTTRNMALMGCSSLYGGLPVSSSMARHPTLQMSDALDTLVISITYAPRRFSETNRTAAFVPSMAGLRMHREQC